MDSNSLGLQPSHHNQEQQELGTENYHLLELFVRHTPAAIAMLDCQMRYLIASDRWIEDYQLKDRNIIGKTHYEVFPELPERWKQDHQEMLAGKIEVLKSEEDSFERPDRRIDWLRWELRPWYDQQGKIGGLLMFCEVITKRKLLEQKLQSSEAQMRGLFEAMTDLVFAIDISDNSIRILPTKFVVRDNKMYEQIIQQLQLDLFNSSKAKHYHILNEQVARTQKTFQFEYSLSIEDAIFWFSINISSVSSTAVIWVAHDITHRKQTEQNLFAEKELADVTLRSIGDAVITTDAWGRAKYLNPVAERLTGWLTAEVKGKPLQEFFQIVNQFSRQPEVNPLELVLKTNQIYELPKDTLLIARDGSEYAIEDSAAPIHDYHGQLIGAVMVFHDVTQSRNLTQKIFWQATHDPLTGLYNRREFEKQVDLAIENSRNKASQSALCYLDLDRFKIINDTCGHAAGDELLKQITKLIQQRIRSSDIFARLGGDEFGLLLHQCSIATAHKITNQLRQLIQDFRFIHEERIFSIGVSIGVAEINSNTDSLSNVLEKADIACYAAKEKGRNCVCLYQDRDDSLNLQRGQSRWISTINQALENNQFCLYTQKIISLEDDQLTHHELLLRLVDESGKIIAPGVFLPTAERYGLMPAIDRWVIETFFASYEGLCQQRKGQKSPHSGNMYTINLSGASINNQEFRIFLCEQFERYAVDPQTICFEITETVAISNLDNALKLIEELKSKGCTIALDDFGSGMSSLTYLKNLPIDYLKIDGSFIQNLASDRLDYATVECFSHISKIMNIKTIAEFVENDAILQKLKQIGIGYAQGYGIEKPRPLSFV